MGRRRMTGTRLALAALASAGWNHYRSRQAEAANPPAGRFIEVDGVRLHYLQRGSGEPLVLLHGTGTLSQDFELSGLLDDLAAQHRVIAFDRPGHGYSERPRGRPWTPERQARLLGRALDRLGVQAPVLVAHSWGCMVAMALALQRPAALRRLVLISGCYYPVARLDVPLLAPPALPLVGDIMRHTISPLLGRLLWPAMQQRMFAPAAVPPQFANFPLGLALRPSQLRAAAAEFALLIPAARRLSQHYGELRVPLTLVHGADDHHVDAGQHSVRLQRAVAGSELHLLPGHGHMPHYTARAAVLEAIEQAALPPRPEPAVRAAPPPRLQ